MTPVIDAPGARTVDMKLEVIVIPVSDVDRARRFYGNLGWRLDADFVGADGFRVVQFTPLGSVVLVIHFGSARTGVAPAVPGSAQGLYLIVSDIEAARADFVERGVDVSEVFHREGRGDRLSGPDPARRSYSSLASFSDPDGNGWLIQEVTARLRLGASMRRHDIRLRRQSSRTRSGVRRPRMASTRKRTGQHEMADWPDLVCRAHRHGAGRQGVAVMSSGYDVIGGGREIHVASGAAARNG